MVFYDPHITSQSQFLNREESNHAIKVLRLSAAHFIDITDGNGNLYKAQITTPNPKSCGIDVIGHTHYPKSNTHIHIAIAPTKNTDRMEWFVEKSVEIGIQEISFLKCFNSERKVIKKERFHKKAISAMKQSLNYHLPKINEMIGFNDLTMHAGAEQKFIAIVDFTNPKTLLEAASPDCSSYLVLIGPEGGFSEQEIQTAKNKNYIKVSLGPARLRTETAGLVACHLLNLT